ncbi:hypothetical protein BJ875DRAFT_439572 [Amylocarpus encephaloides]|uniref:Chromo domain-containing protein n=1 Tax=Amylocarpus encephaloides TaxID=45428 RepID=A0A9P8C7H2_9HELO|nr:hypothetical protein BJ875DRAFT_439572 [Amylocarpus encephaloides]
MVVRNSLTASGCSGLKTSQAPPSTYVQVVVTEGVRVYISDRPEYIPNPRSYLDPISLIATHDLDGVIKQEVQVDPFTWYYIVTHPNQPALNVRVKPQNIGNWVSARTLETWEIKQSAIREKDQEEYHKKIQGKRKKGKRKLGTVQDPEEPEEREQLPWNWRRSSAAFADTILPFTSPDSKGGVDTKENPVKIFQSPTKSPGKGPSLASPVVMLGLNTTMASDGIDDSNDNEEDEDEDAAIAFQLNSEISHPNWRRSTSSRSALHISLFEKGSQSRSGSSIGSATHRRLGLPALGVSNPPKPAGRSPLFSGTPPSASMSSLATFQEHENPEKAQRSPLMDNMSKRSHVTSSPSKNNGKVVSESVSQRYSNFKKGPTMFNTSGSQEPPLKSVPRPYDLDPEPNADNGEELFSEEDASGDDVEDEWEVEEIVKDEMRENASGSLELRYLIRWIGDYDDTWEPSKYVSADLISSYKAKKRSQNSSNELQAESGMKNITSYFPTPNPNVPEDDVASSEGLFVSDDETSIVHNNKRKEREVEHATGFD